MEKLNCAHSAFMDLTDEQISIMSETELLDIYLEWHGIVGFTTSIVNVMKAIKEAKTPVGIPEYDFSNARDEMADNIPDEVIDNPDIYGPDFVSLKLEQAEIQWHDNGRVVVRQEVDGEWHEKCVWNFDNKIEINK